MRPLMQSRPLYQQAYDEIKQSILRRSLKPGEKIKVAKMADQLQISRTPLREALRKLEKEGLVNIDSKGNVSVINISQNDFQELCQCRVILEKEIISLVVSEITKEQLNELKKVLSETEQAIKEKDRIEVLELNAQFHELLIHVCSNRRLVELLEHTRSLLLIYRANVLQSTAHDVDIVKEHWRIFNELRNKNVEGAVKAIEEHFTNDLERGLIMLEKI